MSPHGGRAFLLAVSALIIHDAACGSVALTTSKDFGYTDVLLYETASSPLVLEFQVRACNDVHLALQAQCKNITDNMFEVVIGGWSNSKSAVRLKTQGDLMKEFGGNALNCTAYVGFRLEWNETSVAVFKGTQQLFQYDRSAPTPLPRCVGISTGYNSNGSWILEQQPGVVNLLYSPLPSSSSAFDQSSSMLTTTISMTSSVELVEQSSTVELAATSSVLESMDSVVSTLELLDDSSTMELAVTSSVPESMDSAVSTLELVDDSSTLELVDASSTVELVDDSSTLELVDASSTVELLHSSFTVEQVELSCSSLELWHSSTIFSAPLQPTPPQSDFSTASTEWAHDLATQSISSELSTHLDTSAPTIDDGSTATTHHLASTTQASSPSPLCPCQCQNSLSDVSLKVKAIEQALILDKQNISSTRRRLTSAPDGRISSTVIGSAAIIFLTLAGLLIVLIDLSSLLRYLGRSSQERQRLQGDSL